MAVDSCPGMAGRPECSLWQAVASMEAHAVATAAPQKADRRDASMEATAVGQQPSPAARNILSDRPLSAVTGTQGMTSCRRGPGTTRQPRVFIWLNARARTCWSRWLLLSWGPDLWAWMRRPAALSNSA